MMMGDRFADAEWKLDCLQSRLDALSKADVKADAKEYEPKNWENGWSRDKTGFMTGPGNPDGVMRTWWVEGNKAGKAQPRIEVQARNHNEAVTIGSKKHLLVVTGAGLKS